MNGLGEEKKRRGTLAICRTCPFRLEYYSRRKRTWLSRRLKSDERKSESG